MFSIWKLIVLLLIIAVVWYGFKYFGRLNRVREVRQKEQLAKRAKAGKSKPKTQDMVPCAVCGDFVPDTGPGDCGRANCPYS